MYNAVYTTCSSRHYLQRGTECVYVAVVIREETDLKVTLLIRGRARWKC